MYFLYILLMMRKSAFKRILQRYARISFGSACVRRWFYASAATPGLLPGLSPAGCVVGPAYQIIQGGGTFTGSRSGPLLIGWRLSGRSRDGGENAKKMYDKSETASKPIQLELGKSEKNRRNLKLIQTCDFLFFVHSVYNFL